MNKLIAVWKQLVVWTKNGKNFWLVILPFGGVVASIILLRGYPKGLNILKLEGILVEIAGLATVVLSLSRENKKYNQNGYLKSFIVWVSDVKYILFPRNITIQVDSCLSGISSIGAGIVTGTLNFENIDQKVEYLLQKVMILEKSMNEGFHKIETVKSEIKAELASLALQRIKWVEGIATLG
ncbi:hypothetical protein [Geotalea uraniireducens]|uniref:Uncharacterized protein n=1 Tax=Geotalea uraniireducens (strain Rf4) TaxID=351605 RepID=A5G456_GEOUR|nr:hypothetical protein [Geotalea uraniireducens]ABQ26574.1 hypothetical protein Gura_2395 [Geotalea uraniireducens Rf4]